MTILTCATLMLNLLSPRLATSCNTARAIASNSQLTWVITCVAKKQPQMQVEEISFSPFSRTSIEKNCLCIWCVWFVCTNCVQYSTHLGKHEQKKCCIQGCSKSSLVTVTWCSGKNPIKLDLQRLQHIRLALSSHISSRAKSHTQSFPASKCWV